MSKGFNSPLETYQNYVETMPNKVNKRPTSFISLGILAGVYIAIGAVTCTMLTSLLGPLNIGLGKAFGSVTFAIGLSATVITGAELLTGKFLLSMGFLNHKLSAKTLIPYWLGLFLLNFVGAFLVALLSYGVGNMPKETIDAFLKLGVAKTTAPSLQLFLRAIGCNFLVCLGVWMADTANDIGGKFMATVFPVFIFVFLGFEHVVANMYYLPVAYLFGADIAFSGILRNLIVVGLGNAVGAFILATFLHFGFKKED